MLKESRGSYKSSFTKTLFAEQQTLLSFGAQLSQNSESLLIIGTRARCLPLFIKPGSAKPHLRKSAAQMGLALFYLNKKITLVDLILATCHRAVKNVPVIIRELKTESDYMVIDRASVGVPKAFLKMERISVHANLDGRQLNLLLDGSLWMKVMNLTVIQIIRKMMS